jgi:3-isopropylmalate/(R)-2-methylmalate dehydratase small subunit
MTPFELVSGPAVALDGVNIDTDQILPARFLRKPRGDGYHPYLFHDARAVDPAFPLLPHGNPPILIAGPNFGCGSSREGAVYALADAGIRCVIASGFGDIFASNAAKNGVLTVELPEAICATLRQRAREGGDITVDLVNRQVRAANAAHEFEIDPFRQYCLLHGLDDIGLTLAQESEIAAFEAADERRRPWATPC